jgi:Tol biopolymer transport system component/DNA-binding winged helix-turn-helix (wHTH) protein
MAQATRPSRNSQSLRFANFVVDLPARELHKNGTRVRLQEQPFQVLALLTQRAGEVVTREELRQHLWPADTFVDFDNSLNAAVAKIREALGDSPESPRFIETLPRRGYRFIARLQGIDEVLRETQSPAEVTPVAAATERHGANLRTLAAGGLGLAITAMAVLLWVRRLPQFPKVVHYVQMTNDGKPKARPVSFINILVTDGSRIYFATGAPKHWELAEVPVMGGESLTVSLPFEGIIPNDISRDHSKLLLAGGTKGTERPGSAYWVLSLPGGPVERLGDVRARGASWSSDGKLLAYAKDQSLYIANADGSESRMLATFGGIPFSPRWSPNSKVLSFYLYDTKSDSGGLWEILADGTNLHALFPSWPAGSETCCGLWTPDGKYFVFQATRDGSTSIWALPQSTGLFHRRTSEPVQLTFGPMNFLCPAPSPDGKRLFAIGEKKRGELMRYDSSSRQFVTYFSGASAEGIDFSPDRGSVAYTTFPEGTLWRSRRDGGQRIQLTHPPLQAGLPRWSPDGRKIAFMAAKPGGAWKIYVMPSGGGSPEELLPNEESQRHPNWSPKGDAVMFGNPWWYAAPSIHLLDLATRRVSTLPGSEGMYSPRWSPNGRYVAAVSKDLRGVMLFDFTSQHWEELALRDSVGHLAWSRKGDYIYFDAATKDGVAIYRVSARDRRLEQVAALPPPMGLAFGLFGPWTGLDPDDSPLLMRDTSVQEIYALDVQWP